MKIKPKHSITYYCNIEDDFIKSIITLMSKCGTNMNIDLNIISQDIPNPVDRLYLTFTLQMASFCDDPPKGEFTIKIHIGTIDSKYALISMIDMNMSIDNVKKAITELMECPRIIDRLMNFESKLKITFDN